MLNIELNLQPLTKEAFAPYGDVIEVSDDNQQLEINYGYTTRHHALSRADVADGGGEPIISIFRSRPVELPVQLKVMERHPLGSQSFMPLGNVPYIVVVAGVGDFDIANLKGFLAKPNQGVNYRKNVWHHYSMVPGAPVAGTPVAGTPVAGTPVPGNPAQNTGSDFLVVDRQGPGNNCDEVMLPDDVCVSITTLK